MAQISVQEANQILNKIAAAQPEDRDPLENSLLRDRAMLQQEFEAQTTRIKEIERGLEAAKVELNKIDGKVEFVHQKLVEQYLEREAAQAADKSPSSPAPGANGSGKTIAEKGEEAPSPQEQAVQSIAP